MRRASCWLLAAWLAPLAAGEQPPVQIPARPEELRFPSAEARLPAAREFRHRLASGTPVYVVEDHTLPLVDILVQVRAGAFLDPADRAGVSSLAARMLRRGGTRRLPPAAFDGALDQLAARVQVASGPAISTASLNVLSSQLDAGLGLFLEMLREPGWDEAALAQEKTALVAAMAKRNDDPAAVLQREWDWRLFGRRHAAARLATAAEIEALSRSDLAAFHGRYLAPRNFAIAVAGDVEPRAVLARLEHELAAWASPGTGSPWPPPAGGEAPPAGPRVLAIAAPAKQTHVALGHTGHAWLGRWEDRDLYAWGVLHELLVGGDFTSRLVRGLRTEEGLIYHPASDPGLGVLWPGAFQIRFQTQPDKAARALALVRQELDRLHTAPPSAEEVDLARASLLAKLARGFEAPRDLAAALAADELAGRPLDFWARAAERYARVTPAEVARVARAWLHPEALTVVLVGPAPPAAAGWSSLGAAFGAVEEAPLVDPLTLALRK